LCYNNAKEGGDFMKKFFSLALFILAIAVFLLEVYFGTVGAVAINNRMDELQAMDASGHEYLGVYFAVPLFGIVFIVGFILAIISRKIAQYRAVRIISGLLCPLSVLLIFTTVLILAL
jgi:hypothetical protein